MYKDSCDFHAFDGLDKCKGSKSIVLGIGRVTIKLGKTHNNLEESWFYML